MSSFEPRICCDETFSTAATYGAHRRWKHLGEAGGGEGGGAGDGEHKVPDLTREAELRRVLSMIGVKSTEIDGLVESLQVTDFEDPEAWEHTKQVFKDWGLTFRQRRRFYSVFYRAHADPEDDIPLYGLPGPRGVGVEVESLKHELRELKEREKARAEEEKEKRYQDQIKAQDSKIAALQASISAASFQAVPQAQGPSAIDELKAELQRLREDRERDREIRTKEREDGLRVEIENIRGKMQEKEGVDPVDLLDSVLEKGKRISERLGYVKATTDVDPKIFELGDRILEVAPQMLRIWKGQSQPPVPPGEPSPFQPVNEKEFQEKLKQQEELKRKLEAEAKDMAKQVIMRERQVEALERERNAEVAVLEFAKQLPPLKHPFACVLEEGQATGTEKRVETAKPSESPQPTTAPAPALGATSSRGSVDGPTAGRAKPEKGFKGKGGRP